MVLCGDFSLYEQSPSGNSAVPGGKPFGPYRQAVGVLLIIH
jgi:hypothetical protein